MLSSVATASKMRSCCSDGSLCIFSSATEALRCAIEMQRQFQKEPKVPLRVSLHVGEVFFNDGKVFGDGVNIAGRVQSLGIANSRLKISRNLKVFPWVNFILKM